MTRTEELDLAREAVQSLLNGALKQNGRFIEALKFYADPVTYRYSKVDTHWKPIDRDQGERARAVIGEVEG